MSDPIPYEKLKMNNGWYCVKDKRVINKSDAFCPAPIGSRLFIQPKYCVPVNGIGMAATSTTGSLDLDVVMVRHDDVISWLEPGDMGEEERSNA